MDWELFELKGRESSPERSGAFAPKTARNYATAWCKATPC